MQPSLENKEIKPMMEVKRGWSRRFDDPIPLPDGRQLVT
jgi:hypothetical protein